MEQGELTINGTVYRDFDESDSFNGGDAGLGNVTVILQFGTATFTTTTDANGFYSFTGLVDGNYTVSYTNPFAGLQSDSAQAGA